MDEVPCLFSYIIADKNAEICYRFIFEYYIKYKAYKAKYTELDVKCFVKYYTKLFVMHFL